MERRKRGEQAKRGLRAWERWSFGLQALAYLAMGIAAAITIPLINLFDYVVLLVGLGLFAWLSARHRFSPFLHCSLGLLFLLHGLGILGSYGPPLFGVFSYNVTLGLRYDKWLHLFGALAGAAFFYEWMPVKRAWPRVLLAFLAILGVAVLVESVEFIGSYYGGFEKGGIVTQEGGDPGLDALTNALDTSTDLLANVVGALLGTGLCSLGIGGKRTRRRGEGRSPRSHGDAGI